MESQGRIIFVTNSLSGGGAERATNLLVNELHKVGANISLLCLNSSESDSVHILCPTYLMNRERNSSVWLLLRHLREFRLLVRKLEPRVIVLNCELPELMGLFSNRNTIKVVVEHSYPSWVRRRVFGLLVRLGLRLFHKVQFVAVSEHIKVFCVPKSKSICIPNLVLLPRQLHLQSEKLSRLVYIGRMEKRVKRTHFVIEIAQSLDLPLLLVGDGPLISELDDLEIQSLRKIKHQSWTPFPWLEIKEGDLLCLPSLNEGDGLVAIEAMAAGVPVIFSDIRAFRRFSLPEHHYFANVDEAVRIISASKYEISKFVVSPKKVNQIIEERSPNSIVSKWQALLNQISQYAR